MKRAVFAAVFVGVALQLCAQTLPVQVNIVATDPTATEIPEVPPDMERPQLTDPAIFTVYRALASNVDLPVYYSVSGTAANGVDYMELSGRVTILAGARQATIEVYPIDDSTVEGLESVVITIDPPACIAIAPPPPDCYTVGRSNRATAWIQDDDGKSNTAPFVQITVPTNGQMFAAPAEIDIYASANDAEGYVHTVEFFSGTNSLGITTNNPYSASPVNPFHVRWSNVPAGNYTLRAKATDDQGLSSMSEPVFIRVTGSENLPPFVRITAPTNGAVFKAPATIQIEATTVDRDGYAPMIEFFAGTNKIGEVRIDFIQAPPPGEPIHFSFEWRDVPAGRYALTARATDDGGASARSDPVFIAVTDSEPRPTIVNIYARDPQAAEQDPRLDSLPNDGLFVVERSGPTNFPLTVYYHVSGSAANGVDYERLPGSIIIPEGLHLASIEVRAIDDKIVEGRESVTLTLQPPVCIAIYPPPPQCYQVGPSNRATVVILDDDHSETNLSPTVKITAPPDGAVFRAPANIRIDATTVDHDGYAATVEFFANSHKIGEQTLVFIQPPPDGTPLYFSLTWSNVVAGDYVISAVTRDDQGARGSSQPVHVSVVSSNVPPTNHLPVVTIVARDGYASEGGWSWTRNTPVSSFDTNSNGEIWWITDWHTNTATFVVRRDGGTNSDLTVFYNVEGTAANGIDYARLPGHVTIPAGRYSARITIWPVNDDLKEDLETIVLRLIPSPAAALSYSIGRPAMAGAVLADSGSVRPPSTCLRDGMFHVCLGGLSGSYYKLQCSSDLNDWLDLASLMVVDGAIHYLDCDASSASTRFYRIVPEPVALIDE